jgi:hypothetical protein
MKKIILASMLAATALGVSACAKHGDADNVTVSDTTVNDTGTFDNTIGGNDTTLVGNNAEPENGTAALINAQ